MEKIEWGVRMSLDTRIVLGAANLSIDRHFAQNLLQVSGYPNPQPDLELGLALLCWSARHEFSCIDIGAQRELNQFVKALLRHLRVQDQNGADVSEKALAAVVKQSIGSLVRAEKMHCTPVFALEDLQYIPLVVNAEGTKVWLQRLYVDELKIVWQLLDRLQKAQESATDSAKKLITNLRFKGSGQGLTQLQQDAAIRALERGTFIVTGGPGTGKTTVVAAMLLGLISAGKLKQNAADAEQPKVILTAPTGKASARMLESLRDSSTNLEPNEALNTFANMLPKPQTDGADGSKEQESITTPTIEKKTLHKLLGASQDLNRDYQYGAHKKLPAYEVVVVDEASMIDVPMFRQLLEALNDDTRLILLGDPNQLLPVGVGATLKDLTETGNKTVKNSIIELTESKRFDPESPIGKEKTTIEKGEYSPESIAATADYPSYVSKHLLKPEGQSKSIPNDFWKKQVEEWLVHVEGTIGSSAMLTDSSDPKEYQILCATRQGPAGVEAVNKIVEKWLLAKGASKETKKGLSTWFANKRIMVVENDYGTELWNGDVGNYRDGQVHFGSGKAVEVRQVPRHESAYAITVHKSQGSEYHHVLMLIPDGLDGFLTKELVYTGITRAKDPGGVTIVGSAESYEQSIKTPAASGSGVGWILDQIS